MATSAQRFVASFTPPVAKASAVLRGLQLAFDASLLPIEIESDALEVVNLVNSECDISAEIGLVVSDIRDLLSQSGNVSISHVSRRVNVVAHSLARMALTVVGDLF